MRHIGIGNAKRHRAGPLFALIVGLIVGPIAGLSGSGDSWAAAPAAIDGVTYGQPKVVPAEFNGDLAKLPPLAPSTAAAPPKVYRPRLQGPPSTKLPPAAAELPAAPQFSGPLAPMPSPTQNFAGLSKNDACTGGTCGGGWPPDTNGDVGLNHYILALNNAVAIYDKTGTRLAAFTEDNLWAGAGPTPCNAASVAPAQGDPIVLYDWLADRFILTWFAFPSSGAPPYYQCIAASKTSDPVTGGWWLYAVLMSPGGVGLPPATDMNDYGKFGLWHDCLYMGANEFTNGTAYDGVAFGSFSRADLYSGTALTYALGHLLPATNAFTLVPSNNQGTGANAAQPGTPNYFVSTAFSTFDFEVRTFTAGTDCGAGGTLSAPTLVSLDPYTFQEGNIVPQPKTTSSFKLDMIDDRVMQKVQYRNVGGAESLWVVHPVQNPSGSNTALQWAQIDVTGGSIATTPVQQQIHSPDNSLYRFMGSLAVDNQGNMALGYTTSNGSSPNFPSLKYAGRLATDPLNTLPQTEVTMIAGAGSQKNNCGGAPCHRWGDYSSMSVDPADDCTFWYVNEYYSSQANGTSGNWQTRIGSFKFPSCTSGPPTTTVLGSSLNPSIVGNSVTFTATVSGTGATPTGNVAFADGPVTLPGCGAVALDVAGVAHCTAGALSFGFHSVLATYGGDLANGGSHSARLLQAMNPVGGGYNVALAANGGTASVSSAFSAAYPATSLNNNERAGSPWGAGGGWNDATLNAFPDTAQVLFGGGSKTIKTVVVYTLQDGYLGPIEPTDTLTITKFGVRDFAVQGHSGSSWFNLAPPITGNNLVKRVVNFAPTSVDGVRINITATADNWSRLTEIEAWTAGPPPAATTTGIASSLNASTAGTRVTFTATVLLGASPTGNVAFTDGGVTIPGCGTIALSGNTAQCPVSNLSVATHSIVATYAGDANNAGSASAPLSQVVDKATSTTGIGTSGTPSTGGQSVTFTATVNGYLPVGTVAFTDGVVTITGCGSVALTGAVTNTRTAACTSSALGVATHGITATFSGDANNTVSASTPQSQVVNQATSTTAVTSSLNPSSTGVAVTFTATVNGFAPTGSVGFTSDAASIGCDSVALTGGGDAPTAQCTTSSLTVATHAIVATYGGDGANTGSVSPTLSQGVSATSVSTNVALASNGGAASVSSFFSAGYPAGSLNNDERAGNPWGSGGGWNSATNTFPQWAQINFAGGSKTINKVVVYSVQDNYPSPIEPTDVQTFTKFGVTTFAVQRWTGTAWVTITTISGNTLVKRTVNFAPTATDRIRILITGSADGWSRLTEVEAWTANLPAPAPTSAAVGSSLNPSIKNAAVTYTVTVTGSSPMGTVAFTENGTTIPGCAAAAVSVAGTAPCPTTTKKTGTRSIVATYSGDAGNAGSVSPPLSQVVTRN